MTSGITTCNAGNSSTYWRWGSDKKQPSLEAARKYAWLSKIGLRIVWAASDNPTAVEWVITEPTKLSNLSLSTSGLSKSRACIGYIVIPGAILLIMPTTWSECSIHPQYFLLRVFNFSWSFIFSDSS